MSIFISPETDSCQDRFSELASGKTSILLPKVCLLVIGNEKYIIFGKMEYIRISNNDASFSVTMVHRFR